MTTTDESQTGSNTAGDFIRKNAPIIIVVLAVVAILFGILALNNDNSSKLDGAVDSSLYQAVFLTNGQVYFGTIDEITKETLDLSNIFYLQVQQNPQASDAENSDSNDINLIKLGNELHGPEDRMLITRDQVLFWENLKEDSRVSVAIDQYQENGSQNQETQTTQPTTTADDDS